MGTFSHSEMQNRLNCLTGVMEDADVEAIIATSFHNVLYYSDFWMTPFGRGHYAVMMKAGEGALIAPRIEFDRPANYSWFDDVRIYWDTKSPLEGSVRLIVEAMADRGITSGRIGVEYEYLTVGFHRSLQEALPNCEFVDITLPVMEAQIIKSEEEVALMRGGAQVAVVGAEAFMSTIAVGVTEVEVARVAVAAMEDEMRIRFPDLEVQEDTFSWCQSGVDRTYVAHAPNTWRPIERNQLLSLNVFPMIAGYYHLLERSVFFGELPDTVRKPLEVQIAAHHAGIKMLRPGVRFNQIDDVIDPILESSGYLSDRTFGSGHSFGIMSRWYGRDEIGEMRPYNNRELQPNMVVSMEPMISVENIGGFRHADMFLITADGSELLTTFDNGLLVKS
ncbi:MAG: Xaa-Pro peptidase family protein [Arenicellales bacterium]|nr:Xaa-Pro peptidase family protein [Arenicellales bacterium]